MYLNHLQYLALLEEERQNVQAQVYSGVPFLSSPSHISSKIFIHPLPLQGKNYEFCIASLQRQKRQVCAEDWHCGAPQNPLQTPRQEPRLKLL